MTDDTAAPAEATADAEDDEAEAAAISAIIKAVKSLSPDARRRIIGWAAAKYGTTSAVPVATAAPAGGGTSGEGRVSASARAAPDAEAFEDFAELFDAGAQAVARHPA